jgi:hypothetical protein
MCSVLMLSINELEIFMVSKELEVRKAKNLLPEEEEEEITRLPWEGSVAGPLLAARAAAPGCKGALPVPVLSCTLLAI